MCELGTLRPEQARAHGSARHDAVPARPRRLVPAVRLGHREGQRSRHRGFPPRANLLLVVHVVGEDLDETGGRSCATVDGAPDAGVIAHDPRSVERRQHRREPRERRVRLAGHDLDRAQVTDEQETARNIDPRVGALEQPNLDGRPAHSLVHQDGPGRALRPQLAVDATPWPKPVGGPLRCPGVEMPLDHAVGRQHLEPASVRATSAAHRALLAVLAVAVPRRSRAVFSDSAKAVVVVSTY